MGNEQVFDFITGFSCVENKKLCIWHAEKKITWRKRYYNLIYITKQKKIVKNHFQLIYFGIIIFVCQKKPFILMWLSLFFLFFPMKKCLQGDKHWTLIISWVEKKHKDERTSKRDRIIELRRRAWRFTYISLLSRFHVLKTGNRRDFYWKLRFKRSFNLNMFFLFHNTFHILGTKTWEWMSESEWGATIKQL
jgi:hypothetical protein